MVAEAKDRHGETAAEVEDFIYANRLKEELAVALRRCSPAVQKVVVDRGSLSNARNPASVLHTRIREAQNDMARAGKNTERPRTRVAPTKRPLEADRGDSALPPPPDAVIVRMIGLPLEFSMEDVLEFFDGYDVLPDCIITRADLGEAFVPLRSDEEAQAALEDLHMCSIRDVSVELLPSSHEELEEAAQGASENRTKRARTSYDTEIMRDADDVVADVEDFIRTSGLDAEAAAVFRSAEPEVQEIVMQRGVAGARNPSSALMAAIQRARREFKRGEWRASQTAAAAAAEEEQEPEHIYDEDVPLQINDFLERNDVDENASNILKSSPLSVQRAVLQRGDLLKARNPSSMLIAWVKEFRAAVPPEAHSSPARGSQRRVDDGELEEFIAVNDLDEGASAALRECPPELQRAVISRGGLQSARNPSSVLHARIREARRDEPQPRPIFSSSYVRMRGLPYKSMREDIMRYFRGFDVLPEGIIFAMDRDGRPSGDAFVPFRSDREADKAIYEKNRGDIGGRYVELFVSSAEEALQGKPIPGGGDTHRAQHGGAGSARGGGGRRTPAGMGLTQRDTYTTRAQSPAPWSDERRGAGPSDRGRELREGTRGERVAPSQAEPKGSIRARGPTPMMDTPRSQNGENLRPVPSSKVPKPSKKRDPNTNSTASKNLNLRGLKDEVEEFIRRYMVDDASATDLREAPPEVQDIVLDYGLDGARNPSSALVARLRRARQDVHRRR